MSGSTTRRIERLKSHLSPDFILPRAPVTAAADASAAAAVEWSSLPRTIPSMSLVQYMDGKWHDWKQLIRTHYLQESMRVDIREHDLPIREKRKLVQDRLRRFLRELPGINYRELQTMPEKAFAAGEVQASSMSPSLMVLSGVHVYLGSGSIIHLGSQRHVDQWFPVLGDFSEPCCFCMTEIGVGSNVRAVATEARYDHESRRFIIHTPHADAAKIWIGGSTCAHIAIVFARLIMPSGEDQGIHAFIVRLRDRDTGELLPGVHIVDCGEKLGLNGVDNGTIAFDHVSVPSDQLLDKFGSVTPAGTYESPIKDKNRRFNVMLSALTSTRATLISSALGATKLGLAIATRYAYSRIAFGVPIFTFSTHRERIVPYVCFAYAAEIASRVAQSRWINVSDKDRREVEALVGGMKAYCTDLTIEALQHARESMGGQGYGLYNLVAELRACTDVYVTLEGDNVVLLQQVAKDLLMNFKRESSAVKIAAATAWEHVCANNPFFNASGHRDNVQNSAFYLAAMRFRADTMIRELAMAMRKANKHNGFALWNAQLPHVVKLGRAYIERYIVEQFLLHLEGCKDHSIRVLLKLCCDCYALWCIRRDVAWFLRKRYVSPEMANGIEKVCSQLLEDVVPHIPTLIDGWGFPEHMLLRIPAVKGNAGVAEYFGWTQ